MQFIVIYDAYILFNNKYKLINFIVVIVLYISAGNHWAVECPNSHSAWPCWCLDFRNRECRFAKYLLNVLSPLSSGTLLSFVRS